MPDPTLLIAADGAAPAMFDSFFIPLLLMVGVFYFMVIRPQNKEAEELRKVISALQKGDRVVTSSGIHGKIHEAKGDTLVLEISTDAYLTVDREAIKRRVTEPAAPAEKGA